MRLCLIDLYLLKVVISKLFKKILLKKKNQSYKKKCNSKPSVWFPRQSFQFKSSDVSMYSFHRLFTKYNIRDSNINRTKFHLHVQLLESCISDRLFRVKREEAFAYQKGIRAGVS